MDDNELKYWLGFSLIPGIGKAKFVLLEGHFATMEQAWKSPPAELKAAGLDARAVEAIVARRPETSLDAEMEKLHRYSVRVLTCKDAAYPRRLKEIYDYPPVLYVRGTILPKDEGCLAVVGTRRPTVYGRQVAEELVTELARNKLTIASGLALGIDSVAHRAALQAGGRTMAVSACGLDMVYPAENARLAMEIMENGALISEYPLGTRPRASNFPLRNRIMSGMSLGVLVVEAGDRSGALITARLALEQNREVFAVPGSILSPASKGTNRLIQEGAKLVLCGNDIFEELNLGMVAQQLEMKEILPANDTESVLMGLLSSEPTHIDVICRHSHLPVAVVSSALTMMELKGMARQIGGMSYVVAREARGNYAV